VIKVLNCRHGRGRGFLLSLYGGKLHTNVADAATIAVVLWLQKLQKL